MTPATTSTATAADPAENRRRLRDALRRARQVSGLSQSQAARRLEWSLSKLVRIEAGTVAVKVTDAKALAEVYGITDDERLEALAVAARGSRGALRWQEFRRLMSPQRFRYLQYESAASQLRTYHCGVIPDLAQTSGYAAALLPHLVPADHVEPMLDLLRQRQHHLRAQQTRLDIILDETTLLRPIGGPAVMRHQLKHLLDISQQPHTTLTLIPLTTYAYAGLGPFTQLTLPEGDTRLFTTSPGEPYVSTHTPARLARPYLGAATRPGNGALHGQAAATALNDHLRNYASTPSSASR